MKLPLKWPKDKYNIEQRFWDKVQEEPNGCWIWQAGCFPSGYGAFLLAKGITHNAARFAWFLHHGILIPKKVEVRQSCNNKLCVNPAHLSLNTVEVCFWEKVKKTLTGCWLWQAGTYHGGYGQFHDGKKFIGAHRFSWELKHGPVPDGLWVLHSCDNPACVKPKHLFLGTHQDNMDDMVQKGRHAKGTEYKSAKLTEQIVRMARLEVKTQTIVALAKKYGVCPATMQMAIKRETWKHVI